MRHLRTYVHKYIHTYTHTNMATDPRMPPPPALGVHFASNPDPAEEDVTVRLIFIQIYI